MTNADDSHTFGSILARKDTEQKARAKIDAGGSIFNYGLFFQYRSQNYEYKQNGDTTPFTDQDPYKIPAASLSRISRSAYLFIPDIWLKLERKAFKIELEAAAYLGKANGCLPYNNGTSVNCDFSQELTIASTARSADGVAPQAPKIRPEGLGAAGDSAPLREQTQPPEWAGSPGRPDLPQRWWRLRGPSTGSLARRRP